MPHTMVLVKANKIGIEALSDPSFTRKSEQPGNVAGQGGQNSIEPMASASQFPQRVWHAPGSREFHFQQFSVVIEIRQAPSPPSELMVRFPTGQGF